MNLAVLDEDAPATPSEQWLLANSIAHVLYHIPEWNLLGGGDYSQQKFDAEPNWLLEGAAAWFAQDVLAANGFAPENDVVRNAVAARAKGFPGLVAWEKYDSLGTVKVANTSLPRGLEFAAVAEVAQMLVDRSSANAVLYDYWAARATSTDPWKTTFKQVFGLSADDFYTQVSTHFADLANGATTTTTR